jgi:hypothetical protein
MAERGAMTMSTARAVSRLDRSTPSRQEQIAKEIGALADLDLNDLRARWLKVTGRPAPKAFRTEMLRRALAYEMQVAVFGGLPASLKRQLRDLARAAREDRFDEALGTTHLKPGTMLVRVWEGRTENVMVMRDGYIWAGERYTSLSAIAKAITGTSWNGWTFFGVRRPSGRNKNAAKARNARADPDATGANDPVDVGGSCAPTKVIESVAPIRSSAAAASSTTGAPADG